MEICRVTICFLALNRLLGMFIFLVLQFKLIIFDMGEL